MNNEQNINKHSEYNDIPVEYCSHCLSLAILDMDGTPYCDKCGSTDISSTHISQWEKIYATKYAGDYLNLEK